MTRLKRGLTYLLVLHVMGFVLYITWDLDFMDRVVEWIAK